MIIKKRNHRRQRIILRSASLGVALAFAGCDRAPSPGSDSNTGPRPTKTAIANKTEPVDQRVRTILIEQLGLKTEPKLTDRFVEDLGADSLDCVELAMALEDEFNIAIPDEEAVKLKTLGDTIVFITKAQNQ